MRQFFKFIFIHYLLPSIALVSIATFVVSKRYGLDENKLTNAYKNELDSYRWVNKVDSVQGFIMGSSSLRYGVSASMLQQEGKQWINFAMDARDPIVIYLLLKKYYPIKKPKCVLVGLDPWIYSKSYYTYRNKMMYLDLDPMETWRYKGKDKAVFFTKFREYMKLYFPGEEAQNVIDTIPQDNGSVKLTVAADNFNKVNEDWFEINRYHWSDLQFEYLKRIKGYCRENGIRLIFVVPPKRADYITAAKTHFSREHEQWWARINSAIGGEFIIGNYGCFERMKQDSIFVEAYHLNPAGQKLFTEYVQQQMAQPQVVSPGYSIFGQ